MPRANPRRRELIDLPQGEETVDTLSTAGIRILQPRKGYRYSLDSLILAFFLRLKNQESVVELGAGTGIISMILARQNPSCRITALEIQEKLFGFLCTNLDLNGLAGQVRAVKGDIRRVEAYLEPGIFDQVCCNPPFRKLRAGRINPDPEIAMARHEIALSLQELVHAAGYLLKRRGRFSLIHLPERLTDLLVALRQEGMEPRRLQTVHSFSGAPAVLIMVEAVKGARPDLKVETPFMIYRDRAKSYSEEMQAIYDFGSSPV